MTRVVWFAMISAALGGAVSMGCSDRGESPDHAHVAFDLSPDGRAIVFSSASGDLFVFELSSRDVRRVTHTPEIESNPIYTPDGTAVIFETEVSGRDGRVLARRDLNGESTRILTQTEGVSDGRPSISADGSRIAFLRAHQVDDRGPAPPIWHAWDVYVLDSDGTAPRRLTQERHDSVERVTISADGSEVYYSAAVRRSATNSVVTLFVVPAEDSSSVPVRPVTWPPGDVAEHDAWARSADVSADGRRLVFVSDRVRPYHYDLVVLDLDTRRSTPLGVTSQSRLNRSPMFTPGEGQVLFLSGSDRVSASRPIFSLWRVNSDGTNATQVATEDLFTAPGQ